MDTIGAMRVAKVYNLMTGANVTHFDVQGWGWKDEVLVLIASELWEQF